MLRKACLALLLLVALSLFAAGSAFAWYQITYLGNCPPDAPASCGIWNGSAYSWVPYGNGIVDWTRQYVVDDPDAIDGKAWCIDHTGATSGFDWNWRTEPGGGIDTAAGATIVARIRSFGDVTGGGNVGIQSTSGLSAEYHWGGPTGHLKEAYRNAQVWPDDPGGVPGDDAYHILRLTSQGSGTKTAPFEDTFDYFDNTLNGQGGWTGNADAEISTIEGMVEIVGGSPQSELNQDVTIGPDSSGKITVIIKVQPGYCGYPEDPTFMWEFNLLDSSNVSFGYWYGKCNTARPRNYQDNVLAEQPLTGYDVWDELKTVIDVSTNTTEFFLNGVSIGTLTHSPIAGNKLSRIKFIRKNNPAADGQTVYFDDLSANGSPVTTRTIKLYFDEQAPAKVEVVGASSVSQAVDAFFMGAGGGQQRIHVDWLVGCTAGAFAPGEETAVIGYPLVIDPVMVDSIQAAKDAAPNRQISLKDAITTAALLGPEGPDGLDTGPVAFGIEDADRLAGVRVISGSVAYPGMTADVSGMMATVDGERVLLGSDVRETGFVHPLPGPFAMNNLGTGGAALGLQVGVIDNAGRPSGAPSLEELFSYADGALVGNGGWTGSAGTEIAAIDQALRISGGWDLKTAVKDVSCGPCGTNEILVKVKIKRGTGENNFWNMWIDDPSGINLARWYGSGISLRGRVGINVTQPQALTGGWDDLEVKIRPADDVTDFFFNGAPIGSISHLATGVGDSVGKIRFERIDAVSVGQSVSFDNLTVSPSPTSAVGLSNVGLLVTISGKVTAVEAGMWPDWGDCFYVDDGSGLNDGTGNLGIRCRCASADDQVMMMPEVGKTVSVTGVMGVKNLGSGSSRFLWTWSYTEQN